MNIIFGAKKQKHPMYMLGSLSTLRHNKLDQVAEKSPQQQLKITQQ
jgi:hypothetical protein